MQNIELRMQNYNQRTQNLNQKAENYNLSDEILDLRALDYDLRALDYDLRALDYDLRALNYDLRALDYDLRALDYDLRALNYDLSGSNDNSHNANLYSKLSNMKLINLFIKYLKGKRKMEEVKREYTMSNAELCQLVSNLQTHFVRAEAAEQSFNLGMNKDLDDKLRAVCGEKYLRDVTKDILPITSYPNTFRRKCIDFAAKIISRGGQIIMKVTRGIYDNLKIKELWERCKSPPAVIVDFG